MYLSLGDRTAAEMAREGRKYLLPTFLGSEIFRVKLLETRKGGREHGARSTAEHGN